MVEKETVENNNELPNIEPTYTDAVGTIVENPIGVIDDSKIVDEILKSDEDQLEEIKQNRSVNVEETQQPLENDNHNSPNSGGLYIEPIIISMVVTVYPEDDGERIRL